MFEHFTDRSRKVMALANQHALRRGDPAITPQHILLGMLEEGTGLGVTVLKNKGIDIQSLQQEVERQLLPCAKSALASDHKLPTAPESKHLIQGMIKEVKTMGCDFAGTEHLLLALLQAKDIPAAEALSRRGLTYDMARSEIKQLYTTAEASGKFHRNMHGKNQLRLGLGKWVFKNPLSDPKAQVRMALDYQSPDPTVPRWSIWAVVAFLLGGATFLLAMGMDAAPRILEPSSIIRLNRIAEASILGCSGLAIVTGAIGQWRIRYSTVRLRGRYLAMAGMILGIVWLLYMTLMTYVMPPGARPRSGTWF